MQDHRYIPQGRKPRPGKRPPDKPKDDGERKKRLERLKREWRYLGREKNRTYTPWLVIRSNASDIGLRPLPGGACFWLSPDIWIESSDPLGRAVAGEQNFVHARVFNLGKAVSIPTRVDFYWADPSVGLGAEDMNFIGTEWVEIAPHTAKDIRCNTAWVPIFVNGGHECLKVNCNNGMLDPIQHPFQPTVDRHAGQRNITVIQAPPGQMVSFHLSLNNIFALRTHVELLARVEHLRVNAERAKRIHPREVIAGVAAFGQLPAFTSSEARSRFVEGASDFGRAQTIARFLSDKPAASALNITRMASHERSSACLSMDWGEDGCRTVAKGSGNDALAMMTAGNELAETSAAAALRQGFTVKTGELDAFERRGVELQVKLPGNMTHGEYLVVHLQQWIGQVLTGGYTLVIEARR